MTAALEVTVTAPIVSFRNPLYSGIQKCLPCPPLSTIGGMLAGTVGGWDHVPHDLRFAAAFTAKGAGADLETYHPLHGRGRPVPAKVKDREFLADVTLTLWIPLAVNDHFDETDKRAQERNIWEKALRRPVWPLRLGRSQDLASARTRRVWLLTGAGRQGCAIVPAGMTSTGTMMRLPTALSYGRDRTRWDAYRYSATGVETMVGEMHTEDGQAVVLLPPIHPELVE